MDNISHALAGLAAGELLQRSLKPEANPQAQRLRRRMLLVSCAVAANLPDLDLVLTRLLPAPLGYLMHHRGHTHTLLFALPQALLLLALVWLLWPGARQLLRHSASARIGLVGATVIGLLLHFVMDYFNSYGLHPFHPFDSRWLYGDMVFILEPVFWVGFGVPLTLMVPLRWLKFAFLALLGGVLVWTTTAGFLHWASLFALALAALLIGSMQRRSGATGRQGLAAGILSVLAFLGVQAWASNTGKERVAQHLQGVGPSSRLLDAALTPFPSNPVCWSFVSVERNDGARSYRVRRGMLSLAPSLLPVSACPAALSYPLTDQTSAIGLISESETSLTTLRSFAANCHFKTWLRFARAPVLTGGLASDARYPSDKGRGFSDYNPAAFSNVPCSSRVPGWDLPRQDLLDAAP